MFVIVHSDPLGPPTILSIPYTDRAVIDAHLTRMRASAVRDGRLQDVFRVYELVEVAE